MIPKIIHQIWLGPLKPPIRLFVSWKSKHPDWQYILWTEKNIPVLKNQRLFDTVIHYPIKADILRYELLLQYGGVFMDADELCIKPIDELLDLDFFGVKSDVPPTIANGIIGITPNHPAMIDIIERLNQMGLYSKYNWTQTGPGLFEKVCITHSVTILPACSFLPYSLNDIQMVRKGRVPQRNLSQSYGIQLWGDTTRSYSHINSILATLGIST